MKHPAEVFTEYLAQNGLRMTQQRKLILDVFLNEEGHLNSEEVYAKVKLLDRSVGQATVYRTLRLLADSGLAKEVRLGDGVTRYEHMYGHEHHDHLICERCGRTEEIVDDEIERLQERLAERHGFILTRHVMQLYGICAACRAAGAKPRA